MVSVTQTAHNKKGHQAAAELGFEPVPHRGGFRWRHAKVACVVCDHQVPWYHREYQLRHRKKCPMIAVGGTLQAVGLEVAGDGYQVAGDEWPNDDR